MTEQTTEALIAEARVIWEADDLYPDQMIPRLVKALEAAEQRTTEYAAAVEKVRAYLEEDKGAYAPDLLDILATTPADALREHDAQVRAKAVRDARDELGVYVGDEDSEWWDGYRNGQRRQNTALGEYADQIEREAGL